MLVISAHEDNLKNIMGKQFSVQYTTDYKQLILETLTWIMLPIYVWSIVVAVTIPIWKDSKKVI